MVWKNGKLLIKNKKLKNFKLIGENIIKKYPDKIEIPVLELDNVEINNFCGLENFLIDNVIIKNSKIKSFKGINFIKLSLSIKKSTANLDFKLQNRLKRMFIEMSDCSWNIKEEVIDEISVVNDKFENFIGFPKKVKRINLINSQFKSFDGLPKKLLHLKISKNHHLKTFEIDTEIDSIGFSKCPNLTHIKIKKQNKTNILFLEELKSLNEVDLSEYDYFSMIEVLKMNKFKFKLPKKVSFFEILDSDYIPFDGLENIEVGKLLLSLNKPVKNLLKMPKVCIELTSNTILNFRGIEKMKGLQKIEIYISEINTNKFNLKPILYTEKIPEIICFYTMIKHNKPTDDYINEIEKISNISNFLKTFSKEERIKLLSS